LDIEYIRTCPRKIIQFDVFKAPSETSNPGFLVFNFERVSLTTFGLRKPRNQTSRQEEFLSDVECGFSVGWDFIHHVNDDYVLQIIGRGRSAMRDGNHLKIAW